MTRRHLEDGTSCDKHPGYDTTRRDDPRPYCQHGHVVTADTTPAGDTTTARLRDGRRTTPRTGRPAVTADAGKAREALAMSFADAAGMEHVCFEDASCEFWEADKEDRERFLREADALLAGPLSDREVCASLPGAAGLVRERDEAMALIERIDEYGAVREALDADDDLNAWREMNRTGAEPGHEHCPDCGCDPEDHEQHADGCRRIDQADELQCGPPWNPWPDEASAGGGGHDTIARQVRRGERENTP